LQPWHKPPGRADADTTTTTRPHQPPPHHRCHHTTTITPVRNPVKQWRKGENAYLAQLKSLTRPSATLTSLAKSMGGHQASRALVIARRPVTGPCCLDAIDPNAMEALPRRSQLVLPGASGRYPRRRTSVALSNQIKPIATQSPRLTRLRRSLLRVPRLG